MPRDLLGSQSRSRSRSLYRSRPHHEYERKQSTRSRSPRRSHHHHGQHHAQSHKPSSTTVPVQLSFGSRPLTRHDLTTFKPMFALYLDIQKNILIEDLDEDEVKGRWKSFFGKWNRGELAEGWYDPATFDKAKASATKSTDANREDTREPESHRGPEHVAHNRRAGTTDEEDEDDDYGPTLPGQELSRSIASGLTSKHGPAIPKLQDLQYQREVAAEDAAEARREQIQGIRSDRKADRAQQKYLMDEMAPKAEPGSRERQLEKKREVAASNRAFASSKEQGDSELPEADVMGGGDSVAELKRMKEAQERKKNERELRREEVLRARQAEREERVREMREKEEKTMSMLKEIAWARFGAGAGDAG